jgi:hypothetical protein
MPAASVVPLPHIPTEIVPMELTSPTGKEYISGVVKLGDSSAGAGIRQGKSNFLSFKLNKQIEP